VEWVSFMIARVLDRTPVSEPGGGKVNLARRRMHLGQGRTSEADAGEEDAAYLMEVTARV
jgi:hypothetical protein